MPPVFAGRETEKQIINTFARGLSKKNPFNGLMCVIGPRGTGKTCLMTWMEKTLDQAKLSSWVTNASKLPSDMNQILEDIFKRIPKPLFKRISTIKPDEFTMGEGGLKAKWLLSNEAQQVQTLASMIHDRPFTLCVDEAHNIEPELLGALLNFAQDMTRQQVPFLLTLVGTPELQATLRHTKSTFHERGEKIRLSTLLKEDTIIAINEPLEKLGIHLSKHELEQAVEQTHGYPYFIQLFGESVHRSMNHDLSHRGYQVAVDSFCQKKKAFYHQRYLELLELDLIESACRVSTALRNKGYLSIKDVYSSMQENDDRNTKNVKSQVGMLINKGFIFDLKPDQYEIGIPSLATYVLEKEIDPPPETGDSSAHIHVR